MAVNGHVFHGRPITVLSRARSLLSPPASLSLSLSVLPPCFLFSLLSTPSRLAIPADSQRLCESARSFFFLPFSPLLLCMRPLVHYSTRGTIDGISLFVESGSKSSARGVRAGRVFPSSCALRLMNRSEYRAILLPRDEDSLDRRVPEDDCAVRPDHRLIDLWRKLACVISSHLLDHQNYSCYAEQRTRERER